MDFIILLKGQLKRCVTVKQLLYSKKQRYALIFPIGYISTKLIFARIKIHPINYYEKHIVRTRFNNYII